MRIAVAEAAEVDDREQARHARRALAPRQTEADVLGHGQVREEGVVLEDHADLAPLGRHPGAAAGHGAVGDSIVPASGASKPAIRRSSVVLPQPDGPSSATISPRSTQSCARSTAWTAPKRFDTPWQQIIPQAM